MSLSIPNARFENGGLLQPARNLGQYDSWRQPNCKVKIDKTHWVAKGCKMYFVFDSYNRVFDLINDETGTLTGKPLGKDMLELDINVKHFVADKKPGDLVTGNNFTLFLPFELTVSSASSNFTYGQFTNTGSAYSWGLYMYEGGGQPKVNFYVASGQGFNILTNGSFAVGDMIPLVVTADSTTCTAYPEITTKSTHTGGAPWTLGTSHSFRIGNGWISSGHEFKTPAFGLWDYTWTEEQVLEFQKNPNAHLIPA